MKPTTVPSSAPAIERTQSAGDLLLLALTAAGIKPSRNGHASTHDYRITVETPDGGDILITGMGAQKDQTSEQCGWKVNFYPNSEDQAVATELYEGTADLHTNTVAVVAVVRACIRLHSSPRYTWEPLLCTTCQDPRSRFGRDFDDPNNAFVCTTCTVHGHMPYVSGAELAGRLAPGQILKVRTWALHVGTPFRTGDESPNRS
ncbi:hypothetical protein [Streptomyces triculaminicus]|uniref:hypothetical protein n=1 Tax=Streptomyces triculaminicus TaxID=2816232 RepID=UPI0037D4F2E8